MIDHVWCKLNSFVTKRSCVTLAPGCYSSAIKIVQMCVALKYKPLRADRHYSNTGRVQTSFNIDSYCHLSPLYLKVHVQPGLASCINKMVAIIICMYATHKRNHSYNRTQTLEIRMNGGLLLDTVTWQLLITFLSLPSYSPCPCAMSCSHIPYFLAIKRMRLYLHRKKTCA
jgi:hypothetical protein